MKYLGIIIDHKLSFKSSTMLKIGKKIALSLKIGNKLN